MLHSHVVIGAKEGWGEKKRREIKRRKKKRPNKIPGGLVTIRDRQGVLDLPLKVTSDHVFLSRQYPHESQNIFRNFNNFNFFFSFSSIHRTPLLTLHRCTFNISPVHYLSSAAGMASSLRLGSAALRSSSMASKPVLQAAGYNALRHYSSAKAPVRTQSPEMKVDICANRQLLGCSLSRKLSPPRFQRR